MKDVIDTLEKGVLYNIVFFFPGKDFICHIGKYGLSGRPVEHFSCSESSLSAVQPAMVRAIFKITESL